MTKEFNQQEGNKNPHPLIVFLINLRKLFTSGKPVTDEQIEARRKDYWKCSSCREINDKDMENCWKCDDPRPAVVEYPGEEEIRKELEEENRPPLIGAGIVCLVFSGITLFTGYIYDSRKGEWPDFLTVVITGLFTVSGIALIIYGVIRKIFRK